MVDIDERVVQMKFDSSDFEKKSKSTFSVLDKLHEKLSFKDVTDEHSMNIISENVQKMADKAYTIVDRMIDKIKDDIANKLVKFLQENTVGQIKAGWDKYADMTTSVATLKAQGYAMDTITEQLERLNYFTDETSYNFTDMVREIGKFTASGQSLEDATQAMMGIAEWAALSGKNANEASRAMYQLSQALGAGKIRRQDWMSIQNLNMDTKEFRENAIEAGIAMGTLKENADGTYTTLVGKKANKLSFTVQSFADNLTEGEWFTADVMMKVFNQYSEAVDKIKEMYDESQETDEPMTTAEVVKAINDNNKNLIAKFEDTELDKKDLDKLLKRWSRVEKVTDETVENYAEANKLSKEMARTVMNKNYAEYLEEYTKMFHGTVEEAEAALADWQSYVPEFGMKAFKQAQEAKTFTEAIESAKDAASTVWTQMFQTIFGNYDEARALWTDLANSMYDIFVERLNNIKEIFDYWKHGEAQEYEDQIKELKKEYNKIANRGKLTEADKTRMEEIKKEIEDIQNTIETSTRNGRTILFQGIYAIGGGFKSIIENFRKAWDSLFGENETGKKLIDFSERVRDTGFRFYMFMKELGESDFYKNIAIGLKNILGTFNDIKNVVGAAISQLLPKGTTLKTLLITLSAKFKELTEKIRPSQETLARLARALRGVGSIIRGVAKLLYGIYKAIVEPILSTIWEVVTSIGNIILEVFGSIGDIFFEFEDGATDMEMFAKAGEKVKEVLHNVLDFIKEITSKIVTFFGPAIEWVADKLKGFADIIGSIFGAGGGKNAIDKIGDSFKGLGTRIKNATSGLESFSEIFARYKNGKGASNFLGLIGDLLVNIVQKIGMVGAAIIGVEDVVKESKFAEKITNIKDLLGNVLIGIKWLFTNLLVPIFQTVITGVRASMDTITQAFKEGDIITILDVFRSIAKSIMSLQLVKILTSISKLMSSQGILKIIRNAAKAIKSFSKYWDKKALNETASALLKISIALGILFGMALLLTTLSDDRFAKLKNALIVIAEAMGIIVVSLLGLSIAVRIAGWSFLAVGAMVVSFALALMVVVKTITTLSATLSALTEEDKGSLAQALSVIAGFAASVLGFIGTLRLVAGKDGVQMIFGIAASLAGLGIAMLAFAYAMGKVAELLGQYDFLTLLKALGITVLGIIALAVAARIISKAGEMSIASGIANAIATIGLVSAFVFILLPVLEELAINKDNFADFAAAMAIFAGMMLTVAGSLAMINASGNGLTSLMSMLTFQLLTNFIKSSIMPFLKELKEINFEEHKGGLLTLSWVVGLIALTIVAIGASIKMILSGISKIAWKTMLVIIAGVIGTIFAIKKLADQIGSADNIWDVAGPVLAAFALISAVLVALSFFIGKVNSSINEKTGDNVVKAMKIMFGIIVAICGTMIIAIAEAAFLFKDNLAAEITTFVGIMAVIAVSVGMIGGMFSKLVTAIGKAMPSVNTKEKSDNSSKVVQALKMILGTIIAIGAVMVTMIAEIVGLFAVGMPPGWIAVIGLILGAVLPTAIGIIGNAYTKIFKQLHETFKDADSKEAENIVRSLKIMLGSIIAIGSTMFASLAAIGATYSSGYEWMGALNAGIIGAAICVMIEIMADGFNKMLTLLKDPIFKKDDQFARFKAILIIFGSLIAGIVLAIGGTLAAMAKFTVASSIPKIIANAIIVMGVFVGLVYTMTKSMQSIVQTLNQYKVDKNGFKSLVAIAATMVATMLATIAIILTLDDVNVEDLKAAVSAVLIIVASVASIALAMNYLLEIFQETDLTKNRMKVLGMLLIGSLITLALIGLTVIPAMKNLDNVPWDTALSAIGAISVMLLAIGGMYKLMISNEIFKTDLMGILSRILFVFVTLGSIALFADDIYNAFLILKDVEWGPIIKGLVSTLGMMYAVILAAKWLGGEENSFKVLKGLAISLLALVGSMGIIAWLGKDVAEFFKMFDDISLWGIIKAVAVIAAMTLGVSAIGSAMQAAIVPILVFCGVLALVAVTLKLVASAIEDLKDVFGGNTSVSYEKVDTGVSARDLKNARKSGQQTAKSFNKGFTSTERMNSPSKVYRQYGGYIVQGLALGVKDNASLAEYASSGLADEINDSFCEELGIASPSKVFYENGRFVVRGFINGAGSQNDKLNTLGTTIGDSVTNGITDAFKDFDLSSDFDLWGGKDPDEFISNAVDQIAGDKDSGTGLLGGLWNMIVGEDDVRYETVTRKMEDGFAAWEDYVEGKKREMWEIAKTPGGKESEAYRAVENELNNALETGTYKVRQRIKTNNGLKGVITDAIGGILGDGTISEKLDKLWKWVTEKFHNFFDKENGEGTKSIKEIAGDVVDVIDEKVNGTSTDSATSGSVAENFATKTIDTIKSKVGSFEEIAKTAGGAFVKGVGEGILNSPIGPYLKAFAKVLGVGNVNSEEAKKIQENNQLILDSFDKMDVTLANTVWSTRPDETGEWYSQMLTEGVARGLLKYADGVYSIVEDCDMGLLLQLLSDFKINSPSKVTEGVGMYLMEGLGVGIKEGVSSALNSLQVANGLITEGVIDGMNGVVKAAEEEVHPQIVPVFDNTAIQNGVEAVNTKFGGLNQNVQATVDSFARDYPNYDNQFALLNQSIAGTNALVSSLIQLLEEGDVITVNVNTETDTNGLYDFIVKTNHENFKRTGKNKLAY